jgi:prepilin-type N-terminal cleavage/methylation domain-containing protein
MKCRDKGITLVETLIAVMILSILALSLYTVFKSGTDAWTKSESRLEIYQNARAALDQITRELVGAFAVTGVNTFVGQNGGGAAPDTLVFLTGFGDRIYRIRYRLDTTSHILRRSYIDYSVTPGSVYTDDPETVGTSIDFVTPSLSARVNNIQFTYLPQIAQADAPVFLGDWTNAGRVQNEWPGGEAADTLPEAVQIVLTMRAVPNDPNGATYTFETIVYLPNSEVE